MKQLTDEAIDRGHAVHVVAPICDRFSQALEKHGARMHYFADLELTQRWINPLRWSRHLTSAWKVSSRLADLALRVKADVLCVNGENLLLAPRAGRAANRPVAVIQRGPRLAEIGLAGRFYFGIQRRWVQQYIAISQASRQALLGMGLPGKRIAVIYNGVDTAAYNEGPPPVRLAESLGINQGRRVVGAVAHLEARKGAHYMVDAFCRLAERIPDAVCLLVGGNDEPNGSAFIASLRQRVIDRGLEARAIFLGYREDVPELLRLMDVVAHPSPAESFGRSIAEAMACGRAVVGFDVGAVAELIDHGRTGLVVKPFDTAAFATAIERLLNDEPLRRRMGAAGRQRACELYDLKHNIADCINLLEQLADDHSRNT